ncbi:MAG: pyruvate:ferredoxin (flavodoxin) oxidoreductase [Megasphaera sp.]|jgi:pyruvate-ferredoxin/flavodoxin oxidoreductase|nr:pyruvate:ferredoxin (flavodoxin) oxidoreductase [Megasphaera sp.]MCI1247485.1 pyruvate:ferredoxin (flavodoxin) oxidoreductase [Megasphaera sp.]
MSKKMMTMDGNTAAAYVSYVFTDVAAIYPITPSSTMAEKMDEWATKGVKNMFGQVVKVQEMQAEGGAAGAVHGSLISGALTTTYTASQGLLLMIPNMYKIAGEMLPGVFHVAARALGTNTLCIFGDQRDVMACRQTGFAMLAEASVQETMDLSAVAHLAAIKGRVPFLNFFDGFRTSHEIQKIEALDYDDLADLVDMDAVRDFRDRGTSPDHPTTKGSLENSDIYFQQQEVQNKYYEALPDIVEEYMNKISVLTGRQYHPFTYYGAPDADRMIIAMGSLCDAVEETVDYLNARGEKVGLLSVHLYRPFSEKYFLKYIPDTVKKIAVLDRTKEPGAVAEPLFLDVKGIYEGKPDAPQIVGGRAGLGGKDTTPSHILAVFENLKQQQPKNHFTVGIIDDITHTSLQPGEDIDTTPKGTTACKFWGLGSDGTVGANKSAIKIIGNHTDMYAQAYFAYDSKKSGGITVSHLRFGKSPIKSPYLINKAAFVSCSQQSYVYKYNVLAGLKKGGNFLLNTIWTPEELNQNLPASMKRYIAKNNIRFYTMNAVDIARQIGLGGRFNMIMQAAFFKIADIIPIADAVTYLKDAVVTSYGKKGQHIVDMNNEAIDKGISEIVEIPVPADWETAKDTVKVQKQVPEFITKIQNPVNAQEGDSLPVSAFIGLEDGAYPQGTAAYEKRGVAIAVPEWQAEKCIQCNQCAFVCPHAAIRPILLTDAEAAAAPAGLQTRPAVGAKGLNFTMAVSVMDCLGCGSCVAVCPAKEKVLDMKPFASQEDKASQWDYVVNVATKENPMNKFTVKGSQFEQPLLEFSGACAGCGETPYAKLVTQLFGDRMMVANATGCSSVWSSSVPSMPYTTNDKGHGPGWANSLFEDNAEFGLGMFLGTTQMRDKIAMDIREAMDAPQMAPADKAILQEWLDQKDSSEGTRERADAVTSVAEKMKDSCPVCARIYQRRDDLVKRSQWIFGGDGWAYDIGFGGLDHVLAQGENVNVMVFDTEVYSNTGGQSSKATPTSAIAKFAAGGKKTKKKDLGRIAMTYGYVYVAQVAIGADKNQCLKAVKEAEAYDGPSLIICYAPCINHGIKKGMANSQIEAKLAVDAGYWHLYRYNPDVEAAGKNGFTLDSKDPQGNFREFLLGEVRYASLKTVFPEKAEEFFTRTEKDMDNRLASYKRLAGK